MTDSFSSSGFLYRPTENALAGSRSLTKEKRFFYNACISNKSRIPSNPTVDPMIPALPIYGLAHILSYPLLKREGASKRTFPAATFHEKDVKISLFSFNIKMRKSQMTKDFFLYFREIERFEKVL